MARGKMQVLHDTVLVALHVEDRFCRLLSDISRRADTRFLIITHHRLTMAKMDRLFGVTMAERGVSSLVSVDLRQAELYAESRQEELFD